MANIIQNNQVIYVEPNAMDDITTYKDSVSGRSVRKSVSSEDLCISVELEVEVKGRTSYGTDDGNSAIKLTWQSTTTGQSVNFMSGSKIHFDNGNGGWINSLTTNYTENTTINDIANKGTAEMFGIKSIDISYNNFMVPQVTIQFTDVRGTSLFAQEELRHNLVSNGVQYSANNDIEGSFFKAFFIFPHPKFTLKVKGFYGEPVSYELCCNDVRSAFDANSGSYNVTANFIGFAFSFLGDITTNVLLSAPYSSYIGKAYWDEKINNEFKVKDENGQYVSMERLGEICKKYKSIQESVDKQLSENSFPDLLRREGYDERTIKQAESIDLSEIINQYNTCINTLKQAIQQNPDKELGEGDCVISAGTSRAIFRNSSVEDFEKDGKVAQSFNRLKLLLSDLAKNNEKNTHVNTLVNWYNSQSGNVELKIYHDCDYAFDNDYIPNRTSAFTDSDLSNAVQEKGRSYLNDKQTYFDAWESGLNSKLYIYNDCGLSTIIGSIDTNSYADNDVDSTKTELVNKLTNEEFRKVFSFLPTVENITKIIMAHLETYIYMISHCANSIIQSGAARNVDALGVSLDDFSDVNSKQIAPFPGFTRVVDENGVKRRENAWIGNTSHPEKFEEINLVNGLLEGIEGVSSDMQYAAISTSNESPFKWERSSALKPTSFLDLFVSSTSGGNVFGLNEDGGQLDLDNVDYLYKVFVNRGITTLYTQGKSNDNKFAIAAGKADAENFYTYYSKSDLTKLKNAIKKLDIDNSLIIKSNLVREDGDSYVYVGYNISSTNNDTVYILPVNNYAYDSSVSKYGTFVAASKKMTNCDTIRYRREYSGEDVNIIISKNEYLDYIDRSLSSIDDNDLKSLFVDNGASFDNNKIFNNLLYATYIDGNGTSKMVKDVIGFNENGSVSNPDSISIDFSCIFDGRGDLVKTHHFYGDYSNTNDKNANYKKACDFLLNFVEFSDVDNRCSIFFNQRNNKPCIIYIPKGMFLQECAKCYSYRKLRNQTYKSLVTGISYAVSNYMVGYFEDWVDNVFIKFFKPFEPVYKDGCNETTFLNLINSSNKTDGELNTILDNTFENVSQLNGVYSFKFTNNIFAIDTKIGSPAMKWLVNEMYQVETVSLKTIITNSDVVKVKKSVLKSYLLNITSKLKELLDGSSTESTVSVSIDYEDNEDIKVGVYNYIKMLYDKWIASGENSFLYNMNAMFEGDDKMFHFIDSAYNHIGDSMYVNLGMFVDCLVSSQTKAGYPLLSLLSTLYSQNKFQFLCVQNFMDFSDPDMLEKMFKPISYINAKEPKNHQNFIVLYPYEASSKLDIPDSDYQDDGFYLNDATTYPIMISGKQPDDYVVPSFGVRYGQQYQNYFKNVQVDMSNPLSTEQSIMAKFLVSGAGTGTENNGPRQITIGQDLYSIYSNNSYTCTVTMLGCAWVQPLMYFVLLNVPFFRGSYMIVKVTHQIEAGNMTTTFTGVRMARTATRAVRNFIYSNTLYSRNGFVSLEEQQSNSVANIYNTCDYAYYSPLENIYESEIDLNQVESIKIGVNNGGVSLTHEQQKNVKNFLTTIKSAAKQHITDGVVDWFVVANICEIESSWRDIIITGGTRTSGSSAKGIGQFLYNTAQDTKYSAYFHTITNDDNADDRCNAVKSINCIAIYVNELIKYLKKDQTIKKDGNVVVSYTFDETLINNKEKLGVIVCAGYTSGYAEMLKVANALKNDTVDTIIDNGNVGNEQTRDYIKKTYRSGNGYSRYNLVDTNFESANEEIDNDKIGESLVQSIQKSLSASSVYRNVSIESGISQYDSATTFVTMTSSNDKDNIYAIYDCAISTYASFIDKIDWQIGSSISDTPDSINIMIKTSNTDKNSIVCRIVDGNHEAKQLQNSDELNGVLRNIIVKYIKNNNLTKSSEVTSVFKFLTDSISTELLSLADGNDTISDCSSLLGNMSISNNLSNIGTEDNLVKNITNEKMKKILLRCNTFQSANWGTIYKGNGGIPQMYNGEYVILQYSPDPNTFCGCCTSGPKTWYKRAGIDLTFWAGGTKPYTYQNSKQFLMNSGMVPVYHCTLETLDTLNGDSEIFALRAGDICTLYQGENGEGSQHGMMWDGYNWRSDCIQTHGNCYTKTGSSLGDYAAVIWRHPDVQEEGNTVVKM
jgi:hypothetical protein